MNTKSQKTLFAQLWRISSTFMILIMLVSAIGMNPTSVKAAPDLTPACSTGVFPCSVWGTSVTSMTPNQRNLPSIELGVKFRTDVSGEIQGIRFYKGSSFSEDFTGHLWDTAGNLLSATETVSFSGDTSSGWQVLHFPTPYPVSANTTYVASFFSSAGYFNSSIGSAGFQNQGVDSPPLHILKGGVDGPNGVYNSGSSGYPATPGYLSSNYWVDVMFYTSQLTVTGVSPANGASGVLVNSTVTASFSEAMNQATTTTSTFALLKGGVPVAATVAYNDSTRTATLTPESPLDRFTSYTATVKGGDSGVKTPSGGALAADYSWSFTTEPTVACTTGVYPCSIWGSSGTPATPLRQDGSSRYELGMRFKSLVDGLVSGIRFYKGAGNTGAHYGHLWAASGGSPLASVLFTNETASGWQEAAFSSPVPITAGTKYILSYYSVDGWYATTNSFFTTTSVISGSLEAPQNTIAEPNGLITVCTVSTGCFPNSAAYMESNYWVDVIFDASMTLSVSNVTPANGSQYLDVDGVISASFSKDMVADSLTSHFTLSSTGGAVAATVALGADNRTVTLTSSAPLTPGTTYTATITGGSGGVQAISGSTLSADYTWSFTTVTTGFYPISIWNDSVIPAATSMPDTEPVELGVKFRSDVAGYITGLRFYKGAGNTGTHYGHLWTTSGTKLAEAAFTNETNSGWQTMLLPAPVVIEANTTYIASYYAPAGHWPVDRFFFTNAGVDHPPLHAQRSAPGDANGISAYPNPPSPTGAFPSGLGYQDSNYWVDVVFNASLADHTAPVITTTSPADGASHVRAMISISATFSESVTGTTDAGNFTLSSGGEPVPATVTYNDSTHTATLTSTTELAYSTAYTVLIKGGSSGVKDLATPTPNPMAADKTWSFTTGAEPPPPHPNMKAVVLVNSASPAFADFQHFVQPYLDNFGIPYDVCDIKTECEWANIGDYALIIIGHRQIDPSGTYLTSGDSGTQSDLTAAVEAGSGLVNFDNDLADGGAARYEFVQNLFGFAYDSAAHTGSGVTFLTQPTPHYITQRHANGSTISTGGMTLASIVSGANATRLAGTGSDWLLSVSNSQRAVQFGTYSWMSVSVKGPVFGLDDLVWRSMVWAARKPFAMQGIPPFATFRADDVSGPLDWVHIANEVGFKPWLGFYLYDFMGNNAKTADLKALTTSGNATASIHALAGGTFFYFDQFDTQGIGTPSDFPDSVIDQNFQNATQWYAQTEIPISKFVLGHYYGTGDNIFGPLPGYPNSGLLNWGVQFIGVEHIPGTNGGPPYLQEGPYRLYESVAPANGIPVYFADYLSVPNHADLNGKFFNCFSEMRDIEGYDWLPTSSNLPGAISTATQWFTRGFDSMTLATLFVHEQGKQYIVSSAADWRTVMQGVASNIAPYHPRYVTLDYACQYLRATRDSNIANGVYNSVSNEVTVELSGKTDMDTEFYLFTDEGGNIRQSFVNVPTFDGSTQVEYTVPGPLDHIDITPNPASVVAGATQQFTATAKDAGGNTINDPDLMSTWSVANGGGTISSTGLFTAGLTPGTYANTVTATTAGKTGRATVNVTELVFGHFAIEPISSPQYATLPFQVSISARDSNDNLVVTYAGNPGLVLADTTGTLTPTTTGNFASGRWSGYVTINQNVISDSINASSSMGNATSNAFDVNSKPICPCKIWPSNPTPDRVNAKDVAGDEIETGARFRGEVDGYIAGVRYYKGSDDTGSHTGHLWTNTGTLLATVSFTGESSSGWQEALFTTPVPILANTTYVVSVYSSNGYYVQNTNYFTTAVNTPPLHALMSGTDGVNGVSIYGEAFPTATYLASNYWVDVIFDYNTPPVAGNDTYNTNADVALTIAAPGVLMNDTDADLDPLTAVKDSDPAHGTLTLNSDGSFSYTPNSGYTGDDTFTYKANDGVDDSNVATVTVHVNAVIPPPPLPSSFFGEIHINDNPPVAGNTVQIFAPGVSDPIAITAIRTAGLNLIYTVDVPGDIIGTAPKEGALEGETLTFKIGDRVVATDEWHSGWNVLLNIHPPDAAIASASGPEGSYITLNASGTTDWLTSEPRTYAWDFDGDGYDDATGMSPIFLRPDNGIYTVNLKVTDAQGGESFQDGSVTVTNVAPTVTAQDNQSVNEGASTLFTLGSFTDPGTGDGPWVVVVNWGDGTSDTSIDMATPGALTAQSHTYADGPNSYSVQGRVTDKDGDYQTGSFQVTVNNVAPIVDAGGPYLGAEDSAINFLGTASDPGVDTLTYEWDFDYAAPNFDAGASGSLSASHTYTNDGSYTVALRVTDDDLASTIATATVTVSPVNDAPVVTEGAAIDLSMSEDGSPDPFSLTLHASDPDIGDVITWSISSDASHGTATASGAGTSMVIGYAPSANYNGTDSFDVQVSDGSGGTDTITVNITIGPVNDTPLAHDQSVTTDEDVAKAITLTGSDVETVNLTYFVVNGPVHGLLSGTPPNLTYTPGANYNGDDSFTFKANDGTVDSAPATVSITVIPVNDGPVCSGVTITTDEDTTGQVDPSCTDVDSGTLIYSVEAPAHGSASVVAGKLSYAPVANYNGADSFTYKATDGNTYSNAAGVTVTVTSVNDAPVAAADIASTAEDTPVTITVLANDTDVDDIDLSAIMETGPAHGSLVLNADNTFTYSPVANYNGSDAFTYKASDGDLDSNIVTVTITVTPANDAPVITGQSPLSTDEDTALTILLGHLTLEDVDNTYPTGFSLTIQSGANYTLVDSAVTPDHNFHGLLSIPVKVNDGLADSNIFNLQVTVIDVLPANADAGGAYTAIAGQPVALNGSADCAPVDTCTFAWDLDNDTAYDDASGASPTHTWNTVGGYTVHLQVTDDDGNSITDTASVTISPATHSLSLVPGWNLVSFNVHPTNTNIAVVLSSITGHYDLVYAWDATGGHSTSGNWTKYAPSAPGYSNSLNSLDETMGFWIHMTAADTLDVVGNVPLTTNINLSTTAGGWNLVAYPAEVNRPLPAALSEHGADFSLVYAYHAGETADPWKLFDRTSPAWANDLTELAPGWGYWVKVNVNHTWSVKYLAD